MLGLEPPQGHQEGVCRIRLCHLHVYQGSRGADEDNSSLALPRLALAVWIHKVDWLKQIHHSWVDEQCWPHPVAAWAELPSAAPCTAWPNTCT
jgi:hypothetical protein